MNIRHIVLAALTVAAIHCLAFAQQQPIHKHCNSEELQDKSCTNPGNCVNACAFWCTNAEHCAQCCTAFEAGTIGRTKCLADCDSIPWT